MSESIKVAMLANQLGRMGVSVVIMNYCKVLDPNKFDLTIIAGSPIAEQYKKECEKYEIEIIELPSRYQQTAAHYLNLWKALKKGQYDIVHVHGNSAMMTMELFLAKLAGIKICIAHSHNSTCEHMKMHKLLLPLFRHLYTKGLACSNLAGEWLFGKDNFEVLPNAFDTENFRFDEEKRNRVRKQLRCEDKFIIGHIGRFNSQKNHPFLLDVFESVAQKREDAVLLLVGTGPDFEKFKHLVDVHPYKDRIILYGETDETAALYDAMDVFVLPSKFEGLPVVLLEAQISGLPCIVSNQVTKEVDFGNIQWLSITKDTNNWVSTICNISNWQETNRFNYITNIQIHINRYDIINAATQLENVYIKLLDRGI